MLIDSHCHIEDDEIARRAYANGVTAMLNAGKDLDEMDAQIAMCRRFNTGANKPKMWILA